MKNEVPFKIKMNSSSNEAKSQQKTNSGEQTNLNTNKMYINKDVCKVVECTTTNTKCYWDFY